MNLLLLLGGGYVGNSRLRVIHISTAGCGDFSLFVICGPVELGIGFA